MDEAGEGRPFPCTPPQKRRYAQTRELDTAVQILCRDFFGPTNYKASFLPLVFRKAAIKPLANQLICLCRWGPSSTFPKD